MTRFKSKFQNYINQKKCSLQWIIVAFSLLCAVLLVTSGSGIRRTNDTECDHPKRWISDASAIDRIPDDHTNKSVNYQRSTTIPDDHTSSNIHDDQTNRCFIDDHTSASIIDDQSSTNFIDDHTSPSIHDDQTNTSFIDDHTSTSIHDDQTNTSFIDDHTSASIHDDQSSSFVVNHTSTCNPANHTHVNTIPIPTYFSTPLIQAHPRHPDSQPSSYPRTRCLHQQNVDEREIGFIQYRNRIKPLRHQLTPVPNVIKSQEISNHPIRCLHLKNIDEREMAYINMKNRTTFYQPRPTHATYDPSEVPLYMRNSAMVRPPPHKKDAPIRCLHMKYM